MLTTKRNQLNESIWSSKIGTAFNKAGNSAKYLQSKTVSAYQYIRRNATAIALSAGVIGAAFFERCTRSR